MTRKPKAKRAATTPLQRPATTSADGIALPEHTAEGGNERPAPTACTQADIARAAYYIAERRGFAPGGALDDWLQAEKALRGAS